MSRTLDSGDAARSPPGSELVQLRRLRRLVSRFRRRRWCSSCARPTEAENSSETRQTWTWSSSESHGFTSLTSRRHAAVCLRRGALGFSSTHFPLRRLGRSPRRKEVYFVHLQPILCRTDGHEAAAHRVFRELGLLTYRHGQAARALDGTFARGSDRPLLVRRVTTATWDVAPFDVEIDPSDVLRVVVFRPRRMSEILAAPQTEAPSRSTTRSPVKSVLRGTCPLRGFVAEIALPTLAPSTTNSRHLAVRPAATPSIVGHQTGELKGRPHDTRIHRVPLVVARRAALAKVVRLDGVVSSGASDIR